MELKYKLLALLKEPRLQFERIIYSTPTVMSDVETVDYILRHECSVARFGDGEIKLMEGLGIRCQKPSKRLAEKLRAIAKNKDSNILVCIPDMFGPIEDLRNRRTRFEVDYWRSQRILIGGIVNKNFDGLLGDAQFTRFYFGATNKARATGYIEKVKKIWDKKDLLIVEGELSRTGVGNDLYSNANSISRILCPSENAFSVYDDILKAVVRNADGRIVLCALGPTATVLCADLAKLYGIQAIDIGHLDMEYEWSLAGNSCKGAVPGKYCGECDDPYIEDSNVQPDNVLEIVK